MSQSKHTEQTLDFVVLISILLVGFIGYVYFSHQVSYQMLTIGSTAIGYVLWGIWHHIRLKNLSISIIAEYVLLAILALALVFSNIVLT